jgi:hypothetical protein
MNKRTQLCIAIGLAVIVLAVLIGIIISVLNRNKQTVTHLEDHIVSAAFIVGHIPEHADTGILANYTYVTQATPKNTAYVKSDELNSFVSVPAQLALLITTKDNAPFTDDQLSALAKAVGDATKNHDVTQLDIKTPAGIQAIFASADASCTLKGAAGAAQAQLLCNDKTSYQQQVITTSELVKKWGDDKPHPYINATIAKTDDNKNGLALLLFTTADNVITASPLYKRSGETWSFVTDTLPKQGETSTGGKAAGSPALDEILANKTYGPLAQKVFSSSESDGN